MKEIMQKLKRSKLWMAITPSLYCIGPAVAALITYIVGESYIDSNRIKLIARELAEKVFSEEQSGQWALREAQKRKEMADLLAGAEKIVKETSETSKRERLDESIQDNPPRGRHSVLTSLLVFALAGILTLGSISCAPVKSWHDMSAISPPAGGIVSPLPASMPEKSPVLTLAEIDKSPLDGGFRLITSTVGTPEAELVKQLAQCIEERAKCEKQLAACDETYSVAVTGLLSKSAWYRDLPPALQYLVRGSIYALIGAGVILMTATGGGG